MSWQRILESARRTGAPVIVTDIAGREPMVVIPFDQYDRLLEGAGSQERMNPTSSFRKEAFPASRPVRKEDKIVMEEIVDSIQPPPSREAAALPSMAEPPAQAQEIGELTLEERFYLEPVDESQNS